MSRAIQPKAWEEAQRFVAANKHHCNATAAEIYAATVKVAKALSDLMDMRQETARRQVQRERRDGER